jgi:hypothetical protein
MSIAAKEERKSLMFSKLRLSDGNFYSPAFKRLDIAAPEQAEKMPPVDPHSLEVLRDGVPRYARYVYVCPRCFWTLGDPLR